MAPKASAKSRMSRSNANGSTGTGSPSGFRARAEDRAPSCCSARRRSKGSRPRGAEGRMDRRTSLGGSFVFGDSALSIGLAGKIEQYSIDEYRLDILARQDEFLARRRRAHVRSRSVPLLDADLRGEALLRLESRASRKSPLGNRAPVRNYRAMGRHGRRIPLRGDPSREWNRGAPARGVSPRYARRFIRVWR